MLCQPRLPWHGSASVVPQLWGSSLQVVHGSLGTSGLLWGSGDGNWQLSVGLGMLYRGTQRETEDGQWLFYPSIFLWPGWGCSALSVGVTALHSVPASPEAFPAVSAGWLDAVICSPIKLRSQLLFSRGEQSLFRLVSLS